MTYFIFYDMRNFEVTLTYKALMIHQLIDEKYLMSTSKRYWKLSWTILHCISPEEFCDAIITVQERPDVVRINIVEKYTPTEKPLYWITENFGRIYLHNGIPLILK
jgi:hypothetical protein